MHRDAGPTHCKLIQIQTFQKAHGQTDGCMDGHIKLPLRGFDPMACGCMHCTQLCSTRMISKKQRGRPDREIDRCTDGQRYGWTYKLNCIPIGSFGPQCGNTYLFIVSDKTSLTVVSFFMRMYYKRRYCV